MERIQQARGGAGMTDTPVTEHKCDTCGWLHEAAQATHREYHMVCGWMPQEPMPSNIFGEEAYRMSGRAGEYRRWIPRAQLNPDDDSRRYLRSCPAWKAKP